MCPSHACNYRLNREKNASASPGKRKRFARIHVEPLRTRVYGLLQSGEAMRRLLWIVSAAISGVVLYGAVVRPWHMQWGATPAETSMVAPGDHLMAPGAKRSMRAITIHAPTHVVWQWLIQLGQGRGGWYSHDWLENLFAAGMKNVDEIRPELQAPRVGDPIRFSQQGQHTNIATLEPDRLLVLAGGWSFMLTPIDATTTRLVVRYPWNETGFVNDLYYYPIFEPAHFVMESGMMMGIKRRAEAAWARGAG